MAHFVCRSSSRQIERLLTGFNALSCFSARGAQNSQFHARTDWKYGLLDGKRAFIEVSAVFGQIWHILCVGAPLAKLSVF